VDKRKLISLGGSTAVTLPKWFLKELGWKKGDIVTLVCDEVAVIVKPTLKREKPQEK